MMLIKLVPTNIPVPASIISGLSVVFLTISTGFPINVTSSCIPPESVITKRHSYKSLIN